MKSYLVRISLVLFIGGSAFAQNVFPDSGNVGIGTTNPSSKLDVENGSITIGNGVLHVAGRGDGSYPPIHFNTVAPPSFNPNNNVGIWLSNDYFIHLNASLNVSAGSVSGVSQVYDALTLQPAGGSAFLGNGTRLLLNSVTNHGVDAVAGIWSSLGSGGDGQVNYDGSLVFGTTRQNTSTPTEGMRLDQYGNVGIGTSSPAGKLEVAAPVGGLIVSGVNLDPAMGNLDLNRVKNSSVLVTGWNRTGGNGEADFLANRGNGDSGGFAFFDVTNDGAVNHLLRMQGNGNVGIGTLSPAAKLDVAGSVKISGAGASMTFPDNTVQATAWNGTTCGGDYAESVDVGGQRDHYQPGDVLMIDPASPDRFLLSSEPYSRLVAGVFSTKPGLTGRRQPTTKSEEEVPMALVGIVPTKVSAENGVIRPGDLLVSSSTPGYAMKGTDHEKLTGAIIGKAMGRLDSGKGAIEVLISLQ